MEDLSPPQRKGLFLCQPIVCRSIGDSLHGYYSVSCLEKYDPLQQTLHREAKHPGDGDLVGTYIFLKKMPVICTAFPEEPTLLEEDGGGRRGSVGL